MNSSRLLKLLGLISGVMLLDVFILSPGLLGVEIGGSSALETASGITLLFCSFLTLLYGSYILVLKPPAVTPVKDMKSHEDYIAALNHFKPIKALNKDILLALEQLERMEKKRIALLDVLSQRFDRTELSFQKFNTVILEVENLFYLNIRGILNKLGVFEASEFASFAGPQRSSQLSSKLVQEKTDLYREYLAYVTGYVSANEEILLKLDKLLLEISQLGSANYADVDNMPCMKEIDSLIKQTKFYQQ